MSEILELKNNDFSNGHIYNFHALNIQNIAKIQIYRKSNKKTKKYPIATKHKHGAMASIATCRQNVRLSFKHCRMASIEH